MWVFTPLFFQREKFAHFYNLLKNYHFSLSYLFYLAYLFRNPFGAIPYFSLGFRKGWKGLNLELTKQTSDGTAIAAPVAECWVGAAIHVEVGAAGIAAIVRD